MKIKTILKSLIIAIIMLAGSLQANAQENQKKSIFGIANRVGLGVGAGTEGIGIDVATPLSRYVHASFGVNIMPDIKINTTATATIEELGRTRKSTSPEASAALRSTLSSTAIPSPIQARSS